MTHSTPKQLVMVDRAGLAFSLDEIPMAHAVLDRAGAPRNLHGQALTLPERISYLAGMLFSARLAHIGQIAILDWKPEVVIPEGYTESEVES